MQLVTKMASPRGFEPHVCDMYHGLRAAETNMRRI
jgi:hypothetical protein